MQLHNLSAVSLCIIPWAFYQSSPLPSELGTLSIVANVTVHTLVHDLFFATQIRTSLSHRLALSPEVRIYFYLL